MSDYGVLASEVRHFDRHNKNDCEVIYSDSTHICIMKLCPSVDVDPSIPYDDFRRFHIRFYIPKFAFSTKNKKVNRLILMINGLNEMDHFTLYDQIGHVLCQHGIASALIPLPDHLHRHTKWRLKRPKKRHKKNTPLDDIIEDPVSLHDRFLQFSEEIQQIHNAVTNCHILEGDFPFCFYRNIFDCEVRVSCLGYSMGELVALSIFLENPDHYNACFLFNSGIQLKDIKLPDSMISSAKWEKIVEEASERFVEQKDNSYSRIFGQLFLGNRPVETIKTLKPLTKKLLFIFGGADAVIPMKSISIIEPEGKGLPIFQIPGISHFPAIDREWNNWYSLTVNLIVAFEENASRLHWSKQEMIEKIAKINRSSHFFNSPNEWDVERIKNQRDYDVLHEIYYSHQFFFPNFGTLLAESILLELNAQEQEIADQQKWLSKNSLNFAQINKVIKAQIRLLRRGEYKQSGELAFEMGYLT